MRGELEFTRLLRVDGRFEGDLITDKGSLVVGPKGEVIGDLKNMTVRSHTTKVMFSLFPVGCRNESPQSIRYVLKKSDRI